MAETTRPTRTHLAQWKRLANEATEGPWEAARNRPVFGSDFYSVDAGDEIVASLDLAPDQAGPQASADSDFIAVSRTAVPALIAEVEALRGENAELVQEVKEERGAALDQIEQVRIRDARIEKVRALHGEVDGLHGHTVCSHRSCIDDSGDQHRFPCPTIRALDGGEEGA